MDHSSLPQAGARLRQHGTGGELFTIFIINLLLKIVTLGIYHFWAVSRTRRYLWTQTSFDSERFEYTGTGGELFIGFIKVMALYLLAVAAFAIGATVLADSAPLLLMLLIGAGYLAMPVLIGAALYAARRYKLTRTRWRGIRLGLAGSAWEHGLKLLGHGLLTLLTLGLYKPFMDMALTRHMLNNTRFGSESFEFYGKGRDLFADYLIAWLLTVPTLGLVWFWYMGVSLRYQVGRTRLQQMYFRLNASTRQLFVLWLTNVLLVVFTLGLASPWVLIRTLRFVTEHLQINGELAYGRVLQAQNETDATGEGLAEALDLGAI